MPVHNVKHLDKAVTTEDFLASVRSCIGTPYRDLGRKKTVACDCIGLPIIAATELGLMVGDVQAYSNMPKNRFCEIMADTYYELEHEGPELHRVANSDPNSILLPGRIGLFWYADRREPQHFCVFGRHPLDSNTVTMIHAHQKIGKVVEASLSAFWAKRIVKTYKVPGVIY